MINLNSSNVRVGKGNNIYVCCPFCFDRVGSHDDNFHMGIDTKRGLYHCLGAETKVLTWDGCVPVGDLVGKKTKVLTVGRHSGMTGHRMTGHWVTTVFESFGVQNLCKLTLRRNGVEKVIRATEGHRWFIYSTTRGVNWKEKTTSELRPGDRLMSARIPLSSLSSEFFLLSRHRERWEKNSQVVERLGWTVFSVDMNTTKEEVFCTTIPKTGCFVLEDNIVTGNCYRCNASTKETGSGFLKEMNLYIEPENPTIASLRERLENLGKRKANPTVNLDQFTVPIDPEETPCSWQYVMSRDLTLEDIERYQIRAGMSFEDSKRWSGRVVFPALEDSVCHYAVGRSYNGSERKYMNTAGSRSHFIYWRHLVGETVIVCEGIISAIAATKHTGIQAIPLLGKVVADGQANILRSICSDLILALDGDVNSTEILNAVKTLFKAGFNHVDLVRLPPPPDVEKTSDYKSDAADFTKDEYLRFFERRKTLTRFSGRSDV